MSSSLSAELRRLDTTKTIAVVDDDEESASGNWLGLQASGSVFHSDCTKSNCRSSFPADKQSAAVNTNKPGKQSRQAITSTPGNGKGLRSVPVLPEGELKKKMKTSQKPRLTKVEPVEKSWKDLMDPRRSYNAEDKFRFSEGSDTDPFRVTRTSSGLLPSAPEDSVTPRNSNRGYPLDDRRSGVVTDVSMGERTGTTRRSGGGSTTLTVIEPFNSHITRRRLTGGKHDGKTKKRGSENEVRLSKTILDDSLRKDGRRKNGVAAGFKSTKDDALPHCIAEMTLDSGRSFTLSVATTKGSYPGGNAGEDLDSCMVSRTSTSCPSCSLSISRPSSQFRGGSDDDVVLSPMSRGPSQHMTLSCRLSTSGQKNSVNHVLSKGKKRETTIVDTLTVGKSPLEPLPPNNSENADAKSTAFESFRKHYEVETRALQFRKTEAIPLTSSSPGLCSEEFQGVHNKCLEEDKTKGIEGVMKPHKSVTISQMKRALQKKNETDENGEFSKDLPKERGEVGKLNCSTPLADLEGKITATNDISESSDDSTCDICTATQEINVDRVGSSFLIAGMIQPPPDQKCDSFTSAIEKDPTPDVLWNSTDNSSDICMPLHVPPLSGNTSTTRGMSDFTEEKRGIDREKEKSAVMHETNLFLGKVAGARQKSPSVASLSSTSIHSAARSKTNPPGRRKEINTTSSTLRNFSKGAFNSNEICKANSMHSFQRKNSTDSCLHSLQRSIEPTRLKDSRNEIHLPLRRNIRSVSSSVLSQSDFDAPESVSTKRIVSRKRLNGDVKRIQKDVKAMKPQSFSSEMKEKEPQERKANAIALEGSPRDVVIISVSDSATHSPVLSSATDALENQQVEKGASPTDGTSRGENTDTALHRCSPTPQARVSRTITSSNASWKNFEQQEGMTSLREGKTTPQFFCC